LFDGLELSTGIHIFHRTIYPSALDRLVLADDDARVVMLFVRLRSLLFELCLDHPVALCKTCSRTYTPAELGTEIGNGCYLCRDCGADLRESVAAHARTCPNLTQKPLARMAPVFDSTIAPAASDRFLAQRRNTAAR
jgi:hypothetical protein